MVCGSSKETEFRVYFARGAPCDTRSRQSKRGKLSGRLAQHRLPSCLAAGLIYRMADPKIVLLIFVSGKIVLTGAKDREHIYRAFNLIYPVLQEFRKG